MAIAITFTPVSMNAEQYDDVIKRLATAGAGAPAGRLYHAAFGNGNSLRVVDVWESHETFAAFGGTLMPILQVVGVNPGQPAIAEVHNIITR